MAGNFEKALQGLMQDLANGQLPHADILHRWDTNRGDDWYDRPVRKGAGAAFPTVDKGWDGTVHQKGTGMSLRAYFAGQVLVAMTMWTPGTPGTPPDDLGYGSDEWHAWCREQRAKYAVAQADILIKALDE